MATCKDCVHYELCADFRRNICETDQKRFEKYKINSDGLCENFKNKSDFQEVKHGEWVINPNRITCEIYRCNLCRAILCEKANYCPSCGAKMDGSKNE